MIKPVQLKSDSVIVVKLFIGQLPAVKADEFITQTRQQFRECFGDQKIMIMPIREGETEITVIHPA
jgi:hypothetical protein